MSTSSTSSWLVFQPLGLDEFASDDDSAESDELELDGELELEAEGVAEDAGGRSAVSGSALLLKKCGREGSFRPFRGTKAIESESGTLKHTLN